MRMSCNGCRVLRKGCSEGCTIRPCLQWIKSPEAQANATVFLAKFYGRAGLVNLISAGPDNLRPAIFRSLLYEACGRIVNPMYGSVGLLWSGSWQLCQSAVEAVLKGSSPVSQISPEATAASDSAAVLKCYDIRHVAKRLEVGGGGGAPGDLHGLAAKSRARFKRSGGSATGIAAPAAFRRAGSPHSEEESRENGSALSADTAEGSHVSQGEPEAEAGEALDLSLGLALRDREASGCLPALRPAPEKRNEMKADACFVRLGLGLAQ